LGGAAALGRSEQIGSLETDKEADLALIDLDPLLLPGEGPASWFDLDAQTVLARLIYRSHPDMVRETLVGGRSVWRRDAKSAPGQSAFRPG
jgi:cytosine/adenosine deaminase-related metal-dependent hydrolase